MNNLNAAAFGTPLNYANNTNTSEDNNLVILLGILITITIAVVVIEKQKNSNLAKQIIILSNQKNNSNCL